MLKRFWGWYERRYVVNVGIASVLFLWQLIHLYWLASHVIALRLLGASFFPVSHVWQTILISLDYTEIPALIGVSLIYINELRKEFAWKSVFLLLFTNSQWLHIFWITDEFVVEVFGGAAGTILPALLAWIAIMIDYLELPVIYDIIKKFFVALRAGKAKEFLETDFRNR